MIWGSRKEASYFSTGSEVSVGGGCGLRFLSADGAKNVIRSSRSLQLPFHYIVCIRKESGGVKEI